MKLSFSARQSLFVFSGTLSSRILGFVRVVLLGTTLGYTRLSDSYSLANETPNMMFELILGSLIASTMVPFFVQQYKRKDREADNALMSFVMVSALALTAITLILSPVIAKFMTLLNTSNSANAQRELVIFFLLFFLPQIFFYAMTSTMQSFLAARNRFVAAAFAPVANNVIVIATLLYLRTRSDELTAPLADIRSSSLVLILAIGTTVGVILVTLIVGAVYLQAGGQFKLVSLRNKHVRALVTRSKWMVGYAVVNQLALFVIIAFANAYKGGVVMYLVAWSFFQLPHGLIANSIMTTMIPRITHTLKVSTDDPNDIVITSDTSTITRQTATGLTVMMSIVSAIGIAIAVPSMILMLGHGNISTAQAEQTGRVLIGFLAFLPAFSLYLFIVRLANAFNKTKVIFYINVAQNILNIIFALIFRHMFNIVGLSFAFSLSYFAVIGFSLHVANTELSTKILQYKTTAITVLSCSLGAWLGYWVSTNVSSTLSALILGALSCIFVQLIGCFFTRREMRNLFNLVYKKEPTHV